MLPSRRIWRAAVPISNWGDGVADLGGLCVIGTEVHDSARIDRQLAGRCGRQGDPGTFQQFLAMDDEILSLAYSPSKAEKMAQQIRAAADGLVSVSSRLFRKAQRIIERRHFRGRRVLLYHEKHRKKMHVEMGQDPYLDMPINSSGIHTSPSLWEPFGRVEREAFGEGNYLRFCAPLFEPSARLSPEALVFTQISTKPRREAGQQLGCKALWVGHSVAGENRGRGMPPPQDKALVSMRTRSVRPTRTKDV